MPRKREQVQSALLRKGFVKSENDHTKLIYFTMNQRKTSVWTKTSHGSSHKELTDNILSQMAKECRLSNREFSQLIDCPMTRKEYEDILRSRKHISE